MVRKLFFVFCLILMVSCVVAGQARAVTNSELDKYRQDRLKAETELREDYAKLGFPSPEELARRSEQSRAETEKLSKRLRADRLERERMQARREEVARFTAYYRATHVEAVRRDFAPEYYWSYGIKYQRPIVQGQYQTGYFAGGQFWPTGPRTRPQPLFMRPRN